MDAHRFDAFTRAVGGRFTRRNALKTGGAGTVAALLAAAGLRDSRAQSSVDPEWYALIRRYPSTENIDQLQQTLNNGYLPLISQRPGFVQYLVVRGEQDTLVSITVFDNQENQQAAADAEADWIAQNLANLLESPTETIDGDVISYIGNAEALGGFCPEPTAAPTEEPSTATATAVATAAPCTGEGCECITGTANPCDDGLVCCPDGPNLPGRPGTCVVGDQCTQEPCTGEWCACDYNDPDSCDEGLICCAVQGGFVCTTYCGPDPEPCTGEGCDCDYNDPDSCDAGLTCCAVQSGFICAANCGPDPEPCTEEGCHCDYNDPGSCDEGLVCCAVQSGFICADSCGEPDPCTGEGCHCDYNDPESCDDGLVCCAVQSGFICAENCGGA